MSCWAHGKQTTGIIQYTWYTLVRVENPIVRVENPIVRVENPIVRVENPLVRVENPIVRVENPIVRVENPTLIETFASKRFPEGSVLLFGSASYLGRCGTTIYTREWTAVVALASSLWRGVHICPLIPLIFHHVPAL
jgi:hypothetical protein